MEKENKDLHQAVTNLNQTVVKLDQKVTSLDQTVVKLDQKVTSLDQTVVSLAEQLQGSIQEMRSGFAEGKKETDELRQEMRSGFDETRESIQDIVEVINNFSEQVDKRFTKVETTMVTKDYLDERLFKAMGEAGLWIRREDDKVNALTGLLSEKAVLTKPEAKKIALMGPFSKAR